MKGQIVGYVPKIADDGSISWKALILAENGQMGEVDAEAVQAWIAPLTEQPGVASGPTFNQGDKVQVRSSGKTGLVIQVEGDVYTVATTEGETLKLTAAELQLAS